MSGYISGDADADGPPADLILHNGQVITIDHASCLRARRCADAQHVADREQPAHRLRRQEDSVDVPDGVVEDYERVVDRVGGGKPVPVDIRIVATSNRNLAEEVRKGTFREDLLFRLNTVEIELRRHDQFSDGDFASRSVVELGCRVEAGREADCLGRFLDRVTPPAELDIQPGREQRR